MSFTYGFYNSVNHDRVYDAIQLAQIFDGLIADGVYKEYGDAFAVTPGGGMNVTVGVGRAWFNHTWSYNDSLLPLVIANSDMTLARIDAIVLEVDTPSRTNAIKVLTGEPGLNPVAPTLTNTDDLHQYALCYVDVGPSVSAITANDIRMNVGTAETPYVVGMVNFNNDYVQILQDQIDEKQNKETWVSATIAASGWVDDGNKIYYSFESTYPSSTWDICEISPNSSTTLNMRKAWNDCACNGYEDTNIIVCHGIVPTIDIVVSMCIKRKFISV